jgi:hypothetical protein
MIIASVVLYGFCGLALAQQTQLPEASEEAPAVEDAAQPAAREDHADPEPRSLSIDDIRVNFATVVENFITARSPKGYWPLKQKSTGKVLKLKLVKVSEKTVHEVGHGRYVGRAILRQVDADLRHQADFFVNLAGEEWTVERLRLLPGATPAPKGRRAARKPAIETPASPDETKAAPANP